MREEWRITEWRIRDLLGFSEDSTSRKLGVDGIKQIRRDLLIQKDISLEDVDIQDQECNAFWGYLLELDLRIIGQVGEFKITSRMRCLRDVINEIIGEIASQLVQIEEMSEVLEVKDWKKPVTADRVTQLYRRMQRGTIKRGVLAANEFTRESKIRATRIRWEHGMTIRLVKIDSIIS